MEQNILKEILMICPKSKNCPIMFSGIFITPSNCTHIRPHKKQDGCDNGGGDCKSKCIINKETNENIKHNQNNKSML